MKFGTFVIVIGLATMVACTETPSAPAPSAAGQREVKTTAADRQADATGRITGKVVETMDAGSYTYVAVEMTDDKRVWAAGPKATIKVGDSIDIERGMEMSDFESKSLKKTFDSIFFVSSLGGKATTALGGSMPSSAPTKTYTANIAPLLPTVEKATGGQTVADIFKNPKAYADKPILIRAKVVKFNPEIMGKNWLHIQDGTGDSAAGTHDLTVTTGDTAKVGDIVTVRGKVAVDKDFGAGYAYPVMIEEASLSANPKP